MILCGGSDSGEKKSPQDDFKHLYWTISQIIFEIYLPVREHTWLIGSGGLPTLALSFKESHKLLCGHNCRRTRLPPPIKLLVNCSSVLTPLNLRESARQEPPKNGVITLWPNTRVLKCKYYVSQKPNGFNNKIHSYSILLTVISKFTPRLLWTKIFVPSNLSKD